MTIAARMSSGILVEAPNRGSVSADQPPGRPYAAHEENPVEGTGHSAVLLDYVFDDLNLVDPARSLSRSSGGIATPTHTAKALSFSAFYAAFAIRPSTSALARFRHLVCDSVFASTSNHEFRSPLSSHEILDAYSSDQTRPQARPDAEFYTGWTSRALQDRADCEIARKFRPCETEHTPIDANAGTTRRSSTFRGG